ncbi:MAG: hypothetical protein Q8R63_09625 [Ramlibacter sp.]|nr:hypothetical protein [Ramlibacter sp.]
MQKRASASNTGSSETGSSNRSGSVGGQNELIFFREEGVNYNELGSVLENETARIQLETLMNAQFCTENLRFLQALEALRQDATPDGQRKKLEEMFTHWIGDRAPAQVNLLAATTAGLMSAWAGLAHDVAPAQHETLYGLLEDARTQVTRLIQGGPLKQLATCVLDSPGRQSASLLQAAESPETERLLETVSA